jgi:hypothetical protein
MTQRQPTAAEALFGHLPKGTPAVVQEGRRGTVADALYPRPQTKPPASTKRTVEPEVSLAQRCDENPQLEWLLGMCGLRRIR